jgi:hypothetical protein
LPGPALDQLGKRGKLGKRHAPENIENVRHCRGAPVAARQQFHDRNVERSCDRCEDDYGGVALPAFDLGEIALGGTGRLRELAARDAALGAGEPHQPANGADQRALIIALRRGRSALVGQLRLDYRHNRSSAHRHYSSCTIMHVSYARQLARARAAAPPREHRRYGEGRGPFGRTAAKPAVSASSCVRRAA